jgi:hypothetical protein
MSTYRERRLARAEKLRGWAESNEARSDARYNETVRIGDAIPLGQPILVGHHSERRHRRDIARMQAGMSASVELSRKAEAQSRAADEIESQAAGAIYDDDPDAIDALTAKIARLEAERERMKAANAQYRKAHRAELQEMSAYQRGQAVPFPSYALSNLGGNISRCRDRLARLQREQVSGPPDRRITARFGGDCAECGASIEKGQLIRYSRARGARCAPQCEGAQL